ncbi:MAG: hypothetical protein ACO3A4_10085 [Silvanigrellaceae bacterium]
MSKTTLGIVVPHTHWDRAWYLPFQAYRLRLVEMMQQLIGWIESGALPLFVLDGQTVLLEDYLAIRPQDEQRIRSLVETGKIKLGPWYTMPDCFLARPESLIRNLQRGLQMAEEMGGASRVGYVPDSFGHFAQLPQILAGLGIDSFLFMRGMPVELRDKTGAVFVWQSPDGSQVLSTFLREGYFPLGALGQESFHGRYDGLAGRVELAQQRLDDTLARLAPFHKEPVVVLPAGGDHLPARDDLAGIVSELNESRQDIELRFGGFEDYLQQLKSALAGRQPAIYAGDLLGQADHPLLRNVLSSRIDLKILNHQAQSLLSGIVEPLLAWSRAQNMPVVDAALLQTAWDALLKNHAHDDICGCSVDEVHVDDVQRFREVISLSEEIINRQVEHIVQQRLSANENGRSARVFLFNPHPWPVNVKRRVRVLLHDEGGEFSQESEARELTAVSATGKTVELLVLSTRCKDIRNRYLETTWGRSYEVLLNVEVPALGFEIVTVSEIEQPFVEPLQASPQKNVPQELLESIRFELDADLGDGYSFGPCPELGVSVARLLSAEADSKDPDVFHLSYEIEGASFILRDELGKKGLQDCVGPRSKTTICVMASHNRSSFSNSDPAGSAADVEDSAWELAISYTNVFSNSRLRLVFDPGVIASGNGAGLGESVKIFAHGQAQWNELSTRPQAPDLWQGPVAKPAYPGEKPYPVHHANDGVVISGTRRSAFVGGDGLHEFEVVETALAASLVSAQSGAAADETRTANAAPAVAVTLHRAVGSLSVRGGLIRSCQAGPQRPTPDAQLLRCIDHRVTLGLAGSHQRAMRLLRQGVHPVWSQECPVVPTILSANEKTTATRPAAIASSMIDIGSAPLEMMCLRSSTTAEVLILRIVNPACEPVDAVFNLGDAFVGYARATRTQIDEQTVLPSGLQSIAENKFKSRFKPFEIQTWKLEKC